MPTSGHLRTCQILVFMVSGTAGLVVSVAVGWTSKILNGQCVLFSHMSLSRLVNGSLVLLIDNSDWGHPVDCSFSTFCPVGVTIYCIIWIWFYIFLSDWGTSFIEDKNTNQKEGDINRPPPDQHLLIPSIVCNILVLGLLLATVAIVEAGRSEWCENIQALLKESCSFVSGRNWQNLKGGKDIYRYLTHARIGSWTLLGSMIIQTIIIFIRLRRNSRRPRRESVFTDFISESDFSSDEVDQDVAPLRKRGLLRQNQVMIDPGFESNEDVRLGQSTGLLDAMDEYQEQPA